MVGGTWLLVPRPWSCASTLGIRLERSFIQIAANGSSELILCCVCSQRGNCRSYHDFGVATWRKNRPFVQFTAEGRWPSFMSLNETNDPGTCVYVTFLIF